MLDEPMTPDDFAAKIAWETFQAVIAPFEDYLDKHTPHWTGR